MHIVALTVAVLFSLAVTLFLIYINVAFGAAIWAVITTMLCQMLVYAVSKD
jgi:hypothetical protein